MDSFGRECTIYKEKRNWLKRSRVLKMKITYWKIKIFQN